ncbi:MAG: hypothetical protein A2X35_02755 [Elusimicrobia bacterium GWA2_61_42]|nr:MAG: hypothetical protein A2X35_02755 [Elusimicrobia bacterium GWA2_61_42]OGR78063.1 MAG: hypothetical protein A2X38_01750 [Elusimicrobia bacterium GWC2_61_25]
MTKLLKTTLRAAAAACACAALPFSLSAEGELPRARQAAAAGSEARALDIAFGGLAARPVDRELFLYAVELSPEGPSKYAARLEEAARAMLAADKEDYAWYLGLCKALRCAARAQEAVSNCRKALELDPTAYPVYRELGLSYAAAGNPRKASETLEQGVELSSSNYKAYYTLAKVLETRGDSSRAAPYYNRGLALAKRGSGLDADYYAVLMKAGLKRTEHKKEKARAKPQAAEPKAPKLTAAACREKIKEEFLKDNLGTALAQSEVCLQLSPSDPGLAAERAPLLVRLGKYETGVKEYERAAALYGGNGAMAAFCRIKSAETWLKLGNPAKAVEQYRLALAANPRDLNALKGLAAALEARSDLSGALETYTAIIKLDPANDKARARKEELTAGLLTGDQMLQEMLLRQAVTPGATALTPEDIKLFKTLKAAEIGGAVDYLKGKAPSAKGVTLQLKTPDGPRLALTGAGYRAYLFHATKDAVKFFEAQGIGLREVFKLRDLSGAPVFDQAGKLTSEGDEARRKALAGEKTWLLPYEPVPASPLALQAEAGIKKITGSGYAEISEPEYLWMLRATDCPEDVLAADPMNLRTITDGARLRYFICFEDGKPCMNQLNKSLPSYIASYRDGKQEISDAKTSTAFFGSGGIKKHRLCENGKIWGGE